MESIADAFNLRSRLRAALLLRYLSLALDNSVISPPPPSLVLNQRPLLPPSSSSNPLRPLRNPTFFSHQSPPLACTHDLTTPASADLLPAFIIKSTLPSHSRSNILPPTIIHTSPLSFGATGSPHIPPNSRRRHPTCRLWPRSRPRSSPRSPVPAPPLLLPGPTPYPKSRRHHHRGNQPHPPPPNFRPSPNVGYHPSCDSLGPRHCYREEGKAGCDAEEGQ